MLQLQGIAPAIICENPRFAYNIAMVTRLASSYGLKQVYFTGDRVQLDTNRRMRLPQKERSNVELIQHNSPLSQFSNDIIPIAVEFRKQAERLQNFVHPKNAVYIFGPEDGAVSNKLLAQCYRFVMIPTRHCLNLATAAATVLWDRCVKLNEEYSYEDMPDIDPVAMGLSGDNSWPKK